MKGREGVLSHPWLTDFSASPWSPRRRVSQIESSQSSQSWSANAARRGGPRWRVGHRDLTRHRWRTHSPLDPQDDLQDDLQWDSVRHQPKSYDCHLVYTKGRLRNIRIPADAEFDRPDPARIDPSCMDYGVHTGSRQGAREISPKGAGRAARGNSSKLEPDARSHASRVNHVNHVNPRSTNE